MKLQKFYLKQFVIICLITSIWVHISEVFRYFVFVIPKTKAFFEGKEGVAEMDWGIFAIWGVWDTLLTVMTVLMFWLYAQVFGNNLRSVMVSGTLSWAFFFVLFWVGTANMGLSSWRILLITLPLSWLETVAASYISSRLYFHSVAGRNQSM